MWFALARFQKNGFSGERGGCLFNPNGNRRQTDETGGKQDRAGRRCYRSSRVKVGRA